MKNKFISLIEYGPTLEEIQKKEQKCECMSLRFNEFNEPEFFCNNQVKPFLIRKIPLNKPIEVWISETKLCDECYKNMKNKYDIDFKEEILNLFLNKETLKINLKSIKKSNLINELKREIKNKSKLEIHSNPEIVWFTEIHYLLGLPYYWLNDFKLETSSLKGSTFQGKFNGPDYVFRNCKTNKTIGFEITSYKWNFFDSFRNEEAIKNISKKQIFNTKSLDENIDELKKILIKKSNKKYYQTDEMYIGIVVSNTLIGYEYYVLEILLNKWIKEERIKLNGVFIL